LNLTGGGAFYSQTPESCLKDLRVNIKYPRPLWERVPKAGEGLREEAVLRPSAEILSELSTTNAQDDKNRCHCGLDPQSQSCMQRMVYPLTPTPSPIWRGVNKPAFTLAEVLITLGVVGIIAAMTLPMLAENYQRRIVETRLKRFYTTFNQAILRSIDVNGPYDGWGYFVNEKLDVNAQTVSQSELIANVFDLYLRPYLNIAQTQKVFYTNSTWTNLYYFSDGSAFLYNSTKHNRDILYFPKDPVRCLKLKDVDRHGICSFNFIFSNKNIQDYKYLVNKGLEPFKWAWDGRLESLYHDAVYFHGCDIGELGVRCSAIIQYNNWEIPADYPRKIRY